jgi:hypothetical protein
MVVATIAVEGVDAAVTTEIVGQRAAGDGVPARAADIVELLHEFDGRAVEHGLLQRWVGDAERQVAVEGEAAEVGLVDAGPAVEMVRARIGAYERVIAGVTFELVEAAKASERVIAGIAIEVVGGAGAVHGLADTSAAELDRDLTGPEIHDGVDLEAGNPLCAGKNPGVVGGRDEIENVA